MNFEEFLIRISNPARRALGNEGIDDFNKLAELSRKELLSLHGLGPKSIPIIIECLDQVGLKLREED